MCHDQKYIALQTTKLSHTSRMVCHKCVFPFNNISLFLQVRHHEFKGWANAFSLRKAGYIKAWPTSIFDYQLMKIVNCYIRRWVYESLGRPFATTTKVTAKPTVETTIVEGNKLKTTNSIKGKEKEEEEEEEEENGNGNGPNKHEQQSTDNQNDTDDDNQIDIVRGLGFQVVTRGISLGVTFLVGLVHMPLATLTNKLLANPEAYSGPLQCAQLIWQEQGLAGFYQGLAWYLLYNSDVLFVHDVWSGSSLSV